MSPGMDDPFRFDTLAVHAGQTDPSKPLEAFETRLAALEGAGLPGGGAWALAVASGRAAVDAVARLLRPGDRVVVSEELNPRTLEVLLVYAEFGVELEFRDLTDPSRWRFRNTSLVWLESPGSVNLGVVNLSSVSNRAHDAGALVVVDNSSVTALSTRPLEFGVDAVVYSSMGALTGSAGLKLGALFGRDEALRNRLMAHRELLATRPDAATLELASLGLSSLGVRLERQSRLAHEFARKLLNQPGIRRVFYPGLESHRGHTIASEQMRSRDGRALHGPNFALRLESPAMAEALPALTRVWRDSGRIGGAQSSVVQPASQVAGLGLPADVVRFSVGLEDETDLWNDLERALNAVRALRSQALPSTHPITPDASLEMAQTTSETPLETQPETTSEPTLEPAEPVLETTAPEPVVVDDPDAPSGPAMTFEPATQDPTSTLGGTELDRYARLREWRDAEAERLEISRFQVASNALLSGVARANPDSLGALEQVKGIGPERVKRYGEAMLGVLHGASSDQTTEVHSSWTDVEDHPSLPESPAPKPTRSRASSPTRSRTPSPVKPEASSLPGVPSLPEIEASNAAEPDLEPAPETPSQTQADDAVPDSAALEGAAAPAPKRRGRPRKIAPTEPSA